MLQQLPRTQLLLETDCPYLAPRPGERNEPGNVCETLEYAAELWRISAAEAQQVLERNYQRLFGEPP
jgi:TatD DNase family protein